MRAAGNFFTGSIILGAAVAFYAAGGAPVAIAFLVATGIYSTQGT